VVSAGDRDPVLVDDLHRMFGRDAFARGDDTAEVERVDGTEQDQFAIRGGIALLPQRRHGFGQSLTTDLNSTPIQLFYIRYGVSLSIIRHWNFRPYFMFETGSESRGLIQEDLTRYGAGLTASRRITQKLSGSLSYRYLTKKSNVPNFDYAQNRLVLNLIYQF